MTLTNALQKICTSFLGKKRCRIEFMQIVDYFAIVQAEGAVQTNEMGVG